MNTAQMKLVLFLNAIPPCLSLFSYHLGAPGQYSAAGSGQKWQTESHQACCTHVSVSWNYQNQRRKFTLQCVSTFNCSLTKIMYSIFVYVIVPFLFHRAEYDCFQIELSKNYGVAQWREDVKSCLLKAGTSTTLPLFCSSSVTLRYLY